MNDWALITGASAGIGRELAGLFASDHFNLAVVARNKNRLEQIAEEFRARHGVLVKVLAKDLADAAAPREIFEALRDTPVSVLVNNAGFGWQDAFAEGELPRWLDMMHVNMDAVAELTHRFVPPMLARRAGRILNVASTAAFQPGPFTTIYFATKAFVYSFSCALAEELAGTGITVTAFCPGATRTEFHERAGMQPSLRHWFSMDADKVARIGYRGLMRGKRIVIPGLLNKITSALAKAAPTRLTARAVRKINER